MKAQFIFQWLNFHIQGSTIDMKKNIANAGSVCLEWPTLYFFRFLPIPNWHCQDLDKKLVSDHKIINSKSSFTQMPKRKVSLKSLPSYWNIEWHRNQILLEIPESHEHSQVLTQGSPGQVRRAQPHLCASIGARGAGWSCEDRSGTWRGTHWELR